MQTGDTPTFGRLLRHYRRAKELTQEALAERAGLSLRTVNALERDAGHLPYVDTVQRLAEALDLRGTERAAFEEAGRRQRLPPGDVAVPLPVSLTSFIGREHDEAAVAHLLQRENVRLLTLAGPGGVGKTRLAVQVAAGLRDCFSDRVAFVALASLADPGLVASAIAQALGLRQADGRSPLESLLDHLRDKETLLLLDNFEHLLATAPVVQTLLSHCPHLKVLATSRAPLRVQGEHVYTVPPLAVPGPASGPEGDDPARFAAVELFVQRVQALTPGFRLTPTTGPVVAEICRRLDGLPLAIELAAARCTLLPPQSLLARLEPRLPLLVGGSCDVPARLQTMSAAITWSYDLLEEHEQALFRRLAVFAGGCTLEAAASVCRIGGAAPDVDTVLRVQALVDQSLVCVQETEHGEPRLTLLETIREYGLEQLEAQGEAAALRRSHAEYYLTLAEGLAPRLTGPQQERWLSYLETEHGNLRAALRWASEAGAVELGLRLAGAVWRFWWVRGHLSEGRARLEGLLARSESSAGAAEAAPMRPGHLTAEQSATRARALHGVGVLACYQGDFADGAAHLEESVALYREVGDTAGMAAALARLSYAVLWQGDYARAALLQEESLALSHDLGDRQSTSTSLLNLAIIKHLRGDYEGAATLVEESLALCRELGDMRLRGAALNVLGSVAYVQGQLARAAALYEESLTLHQRLENKQAVVGALGNLGLVAQAQGDLSQARVLWEDCLSRAWALGSRWYMAYGLEGLAGVAAAQGQPQRAARLFAVAQALRDTIRVPVPPFERVRYEQTLLSVQAALGEETFTALWTVGQTLPLDQTIADILAPLEPATAHARATAGPSRASS
ncbi:MAG TPA: tetratricopeptide repeat protein [Chloroflexota bacterium]|nr:tetratricopeptide repeat protein [Chloroflexota bacterium]